MTVLDLKLERLLELMQQGLFGGSGRDPFIVDSLRSHYGEGYTVGDLIGEHDWRKFKAVKDVYDVRPHPLTEEKEVLEELKVRGQMSGEEFSERLNPRVYNEVMRYKSDIGEKETVEISTEEVDEVLEGMRERKDRANISTASFQEGYDVGKAVSPPPEELRQENVAEFRSILKQDPFFMGGMRMYGGTSESVTDPAMRSLETGHLHEDEEQFKQRKRRHMNSDIGVKLGAAASASLAATPVFLSIPFAVNGVDPSGHIPFDLLLSGAGVTAISTLGAASYTKKKHIRSNRREFGRMKAVMDTFHTRVKLDKEKRLGEHRIKVK